MDFFAERPREHALARHRAGPGITLSAVGISVKDFEQMSRRAQGKARRRPEALTFEPSRMLASPVAATCVVLGIDPSLRGTGWGVIQWSRQGSKALGFGRIHCPAAWPRSRCLIHIAAGLRAAIAEHTPTECAIEGLFFAQNLQTALLMGEARGVCLLAAAEAGLPISEIAPRKVKQAVVGYGGAQKLAVARMVQRLLGISEQPDADSADALAIAWVHAQDRARLNPSGRPTL